MSLAPAFASAESAGPPAPAYEQIVQGPDTPAAVVRELPDIQFAPGSTRLTDTALTQIDYFTYYNIIAVPTVSVRITGFADERGSAAANQALAGRRAEAVADYMSTKGIPRDRMVTLGAEGDPGGADSRSVDILAE